jgi:triphosphatase
MARRPHQHPASPGAAPATGNGIAGGEKREVEWQFTAPDLGLIRRWLEQHARFEGLTIEPLPAQQLRDTYLDTEDWRVLRAGFALRLRHRGDQVEATLKGLHSARDDVADRREITEALPKGGDRALAQATGPVGSRVHDVAGVKPLRTLFEVRTSRHRFAVRGRKPAADIGEIALDEARFSRGDRHRRPMVLTRIELEATGPDSAPLERLVSQLRSDCGLHPASENKFAVGLRSASLEPPRAPGSGGDPVPAPAVMGATSRASDFAAAALQRLLREWQANEPAARLGEGPEPLHRLRVTGRRMDTVLCLFRAYLPAAIVKSRPRLKALLDALGAVRDADVRLQMAGSFRRGLAEGERAGLDPLLQHLHAERARARSAMLRALDARSARNWLDTLSDQLARTTVPAASTSARAAAALAVVPDLIQKRYRKLRKCARRLTAESPITDFHKVRIRSKKLRYALEIIAPTYGAPAQEMLAALHKLQSKLGTQHDEDVIAGYLTQLAGRAPENFTAATLFLIGRMAELNAREAARMSRKVAKPIRKVRGSRWKALRARMDAQRHRKDNRDRPADRRPGGNGRFDVTAASAFPSASRH